ncbi:hypothetical protein [Roseibacillus ishigakijimensis]|uniref:Lipoprotein n=1 Tax=Roseibacillus ishigakijimensis TaxID=454146 RepID=A0A934RST3_9BACT|nr:hypothetical protein [Roseibacillus ishigakijimensis]MBK1833856.1 hypothetical protein [Roseibacillus ishigakijimensis]
MKILLPILALATALLFSSCGTSNPTSRIEKNPHLYNQLSLAEQELVSQGRIEKGMSPHAVYLALGSPDRQLEGEADGVHTMRWDYTSLYPVYHNHVYGYWGSGYGRYGRYGHRGYHGFGYAPTIEYVPARSGTVWFENNVVKSWERVRR